MPWSRRRVLLLALALGAGCGREGPAARAGSSQRAPNFELRDLSGKAARLSDFQGKVVLLDFWATYCLPCHESIPVFQRLHESYRGRGLEVLGVSVDAFPEHVPEFAREYRMGYTVLLDPENVVQKSYGVRGLPTTFLIDREGVIRQKWLGFDAGVRGEIEAGIRELLSQNRS